MAKVVLSDVLACPHQGIVLLWFAYYWMGVEAAASHQTQASEIQMTLLGLGRSYSLVAEPSRGSIPGVTR